MGASERLVMLMFLLANSINMVMGYRNSPPSCTTENSGLCYSNGAYYPEGLDPRLPPVGNDGVNFVASRETFGNVMSAALERLIKSSTSVYYSGLNFEHLIKFIDKFLLSQGQLPAESLNTTTAFCNVTASTADAMFKLFTLGFEGDCSQLEEALQAKANRLQQKSDAEVKTELFAFYILMGFFAVCLVYTATVGITERLMEQQPSSTSSNNGGYFNFWPRVRAHFLAPDPIRAVELVEAPVDEEKGEEPRARASQS